MEWLASTGSLGVIAVAVISGVLGGPVWGFLSRWFDRSAEREEKEIERLRREIKEMREAEKQSRITISSLEARLVIVEQSHESHLARWIKDAHKRIIWLNSKAYLTIFAALGFDRDEIDGKTFGELLGPHAASEIERLDRVALNQPGAATSGLIQLHPDMPIMHIVKIAGTGRDGELIYEGYAYRPNDPDLAVSMGIERQIDQRELSTRRVLKRKRADEKEDEA